MHEIWTTATDVPAARCVCLHPEEAAACVEWRSLEPQETLYLLGGS